MNEIKEINIIKENKIVKKFIERIFGGLELNVDFENNINELSGSEINMSDILQKILKDHDI